MNFFHANILFWTDYIEIALCATGIYLCSCWLARDKQKNLVGYMYGYCFLFGMAYSVPFPTLQTLLWYATPLFCMFIVLIHQDLLQKNFVTCKSLASGEPEANAAWMADVVRASLYAQNARKSIRFLIEHTDALQSLVHTDFPLTTTWQLWLMHMILHSEKYNETQWVWINSHGQIKGINAEFAFHLDPIWLSPEAASLAVWQQEALQCSKKTDAICLFFEQESEQFTLIFQGILMRNIPAHTVVNTLRYVLRSVTGRAQEQGMPSSFIVSSQKNARKDDSSTLI